MTRIAALATGAADNTANCIANNAPNSTATNSATNAVNNTGIHAAIEAAQSQTALNALIGFDAEQAQQQATLHLQKTYPVGTPLPFRNRPFVVKDNIAVAGFAQTGGCPAFANYYPAQSASAIERIVAAGGFVLAKANMHELAFGITSHNAAFGAVLNPFDQQRLAGGSSGGCAAAIAAGMCDFAVGNDTGGSIRIPAALCGVYGFRPTVGRYATDGVMTLSPTRDALGTMARSIDDLIALDELLAVENEALQVGEPPVGDPKRIAIARRPFWSDLSEEMAQACELALQKLSGAGFTLVDVEASELQSIDEAIGFVIALHETWQEWSRSVPIRLGISVQAMTPQIASPDVRGLFEMMASDQCPSAQAYREALALRPKLQTAYRSVLERAGAATLLMPTTVRAAMALTETEQCAHLGDLRPTFPTYVRQTSPASVAGFPSLSVPAGLLASGLPFGLMLETLPHQDAFLLQCAKQIALALFPTRI